MSLKKKFEWCLKQGKGKEHRGLLKIKPDIEESNAQIKKAESDLETMQYLYNGKKTDWVASAVFYAMYHSLLAILYKLGYESRNQECTINAIEHFIEKGILHIDNQYIEMIRSVQQKEDAKSTREEMQYGAKTKLEEDKCKTLMQNAKKFVEKMRTILKIIEISGEENTSKK